MNEDEKQAIDCLKDELDDEKNYKGVRGLYGNNEVEIALKLIEKQQKEIEELKGKNKELFEEYNKRVSTIIVYEQEIEELTEINNKYNDMKYFAMVADRYISKDKIKAKIEEIDKILKLNLIEKIRIHFGAQKEALQSLLENE